MGILNNDSVTVDAILTKHGRKQLAKGQGLNIDGFAFYDDFVNYKDYNPDHPSGSAYYGQAITSLPLPEAFPNALHAARYGLVSNRNRGVIYNPFIIFPDYPNGQFMRITDQDSSGQNYGVTLKPGLENAPNASKVFTFAIDDVNGLIIKGATRKSLDGTTTPQHSLPRGAVSQFPAKFEGSHITISADATRTAFQTRITVFHNETGAAPKDILLKVDGNIWKKNTDVLEEGSDK